MSSFSGSVLDDTSANSLPERSLHYGDMDIDEEKYNIENDPHQYARTKRCSSDEGSFSMGARATEPMQSDIQSEALQMQPYSRPNVTPSVDGLNLQPDQQVAGPSFHKYQPSNERKQRIKRGSKAAASEEGASASSVKSVRKKPDGDAICGGYHLVFVICMYQISYQINSISYQILILYFSACIPTKNMKDYFELYLLA